jgi:dipeptidase E
MPAVRTAQAIVVGGGSTWKLLRELRERGLLREIRKRVLAGAPYVGWSAGANIACPTIMTTNDMPICDPGGFDALGFVPFQINPHYLHGNPPGFNGETREERIREFGVLHPGALVAGLREGTAFVIDGATIHLLGEADCRIFRHGEEPRELRSGDDFSFLLGADRRSSRDRPPAREQTPRLRSTRRDASPIPLLPRTPAATLRDDARGSR